MCARSVGTRQHWQPRSSHVALQDPDPASYSGAGTCAGRGTQSAAKPRAERQPSPPAKPNRSRLGVLESVAKPRASQWRAGIRTRLGATYSIAARLVLAADPS
jgi:hypothetical protein